MIIATLAAIKAKLEKEFPELAASLNPPATENEILELETLTGFALPDDLKSLYRQHNGQSGNAGLFFGLPFISIREVISEWKTWAALEKTTAMLDSAIASIPDYYIREKYASRSNIPISKDHGGNNIGIDMDPGEKGVVGQVINFGRDEDTRYVIAYSVTEFLQFILAHIEAGNYLVEDQGDEVRCLLMRQPRNSHFLDALKHLPLPFNQTKTADSTPDNDGYNEWFDSLSEEWRKVIGADKTFASIAAIKELNLYGTNISDLRPLQKFAGLKELILNHLPVSDLSPLSGLKELKVLYANKTAVHDLAPLCQLPRLTELHLEEVAINSLEGLDKVKSLKTLVVKKSGLRVLKTVGAISSLTELDISGNSFDSFHELEVLTQLVKLSMSDTNVNALSFAWNMKKLNEIELANTQINDFTPLLQLERVEYITCSFSEFLKLKDLYPPGKVSITMRGKMTEEQDKIFTDYHR